MAPEGLYRTLIRVAREYRPGFLYVTENGTSLPDAPGPDGLIRDPVRRRYVARHAAAVRQAISDGADVRGYFLWSFMDNFEWSFGYTKRFGITFVDYDSQKRTVKDSGRWYSKVVQENGFPLRDAAVPD
jgi:beta-glucosidase